MTCINTRSGRMLDIEAPDPAMIDIHDIAHALSFICRGSGNTNFFFPVARHCVYCALEAQARGLSRRLALACLIHDASEAYIADIPHPLKMALPQYKEYENKILDCIYRKYLSEPLSAQEQAQVREIDRALLMYDLKYLLNMDVELPHIHIALQYEYESFEVSEKAYLDMFKELNR